MQSMVYEMKWYCVSVHLLVPAWVHSSKPTATGLQQWAEQIFIDCSSGSALTLLVGRQEGHLSCKKQECWGAGVVVCLVRGADLHMSQLMPLPLTVSCFSRIQIGFTFLVPAHLGSPGKRAVKRVCVCAAATCGGQMWAMPFFHHT